MLASIRERVGVLSAKGDCCNLVQAAAQQTAAILKVARTEAEDLQACLQHEQVRLSSPSSVVRVHRPTARDSHQRFRMCEASIRLPPAVSAWALIC